MSATVIFQLAFIATSATAALVWPGIAHHSRKCFMHRHDHPSKQNGQAGFTLIELMITLVIAAIIMTIAVPSFLTTIQSSRLTTQVNDLAADISLARSEAIKRGVRVGLCRSANPSAGTPTCGGSSNTWSTGWLIYADDDADGAFVDADDTLIRIGQPAPNAVTVITDSTADLGVQYNTDGTLNSGGSIAVFTVCDARGAGSGRQIQINTMGRPRLVKGSAATLNCSSPAAV